MEAGQRLFPAHGALTAKSRSWRLSRRPECRLCVVEVFVQPILCAASRKCGATFDLQSSCRAVLLVLANVGAPKVSPLAVGAEQRTCPVFTFLRAGSVSPCDVSAAWRGRAIGYAAAEPSPARSVLAGLGFDVLTAAFQAVSLHAARNAAFGLAEAGCAGG
jgi:CDP-diglyceride synthetase